VQVTAKHCVRSATINQGVTHHLHVQHLLPIVGTVTKHHVLHSTTRSHPAVHLPCMQPHMSLHLHQCCIRRGNKTTHHTRLHRLGHAPKKSDAPRDARPRQAGCWPCFEEQFGVAPRHIQ
jgi:hypothetical protein